MYNKKYLIIYFQPFLEQNSPLKKLFFLPRCLKFIIPGIIFCGIIAVGIFLVNFSKKYKLKNKTKTISSEKKTQ